MTYVRYIDKTTAYSLGIALRRSAFGHDFAERVRSPAHSFHNHGVIPAQAGIHVPEPTV